MSDETRPRERPTGRHCMNRACAGPEWWALFDENQDKYRHCPSCGYLCNLEFVPPDAITLEAICAAVGVATNSDLSSEED